jgi:hypothetical protein
MTQLIDERSCASKFRLAKRSLRGNSLHTSTLRLLAIAQGANRRNCGSKTVARLLQFAPTLMVNGYGSRALAGGLVTGTLWATALRMGELLCQPALLPR